MVPGPIFNIISVVFLSHLVAPHLILRQGQIQISLLDLDQFLPMQPLTIHAAHAEDRCGWQPSLTAERLSGAITKD